MKNGVNTGDNNLDNNKDYDHDNNDNNKNKHDHDTNKNQNNKNEGAITAAFDYPNTCGPFLTGNTQKRHAIQACL